MISTSRCQYFQTSQLRVITGERNVLSHKKNTSQPPPPSPSPFLAHTHTPTSFRFMLLSRHDFLLLSDTELQMCRACVSGSSRKVASAQRRPHRGTFSSQLSDASRIQSQVVTPFISTAAPSHLRFIFGCKNSAAAQHLGCR